MRKQTRKHTMGLAGEFLVAGELLRRGISAVVTYGNAKRADVVVIVGDRALAIEVKTTMAKSWVIGNALPKPNDRIWVLMHLPETENDSPQYIVLTGRELHDLLLPQHEAHLAKYREKHGHDFAGRGVVSMARRIIGAEHYNAWHKVKTVLGI